MQESDDSSLEDTLEDSTEENSSTDQSSVEISDNAVTANVLDKSQAVHSQFVVSSIGLTLERLRKRYEKNDLEADKKHVIQLMIQHGLKSQIISPAAVTLIETFIANFPTKAHPELDSATFMDDNGEEKNTLVPLSTVFAYICAAILDENENVYPANTPEEREHNLACRLETLLNTINMLRVEGRCTTGRRTDIVMSLNYVHPDVKVVEDLHGFILASAKEWLCAYWESLGKKQQYEAIIKHLNEDAAHIDTLAVEKHIQTDLKKVGINPEIPEAANYIQKLCKYFHSVPMPTLPHVESSMTALKTLSDSTTTLSLKNLERSIILQAWQIAEELESLDAFSTSNLPILAGWLQLRNTIKPRLNVQGLGLDDALHTLANEIEKQIFDYIATWKFQPNSFAKDRYALESQRAEFARVQNEALAQKSHYVFIGNLFALWSSLEATDYEACSAILTQLNSLPESERSLSDVAIRKLFDEGQSENPGELIVLLTPYSINRVLLHALCHPVATWSESFYGFFTAVVHFLENLQDEENEDERLASALKATSYPSLLRKQLKWMLQCHANPEVMSEPQHLATHAACFFPMNFSGIAKETFRTLVAFFIRKEPAQFDAFVSSFPYQYILEELDFMVSTIPRSVSTKIRLTQGIMLLKVFPEDQRYALYEKYFSRSYYGVPNVELLLALCRILPKEKHGDLLFWTLGIYRSMQDLVPLLTLRWNNEHVISLKNRIKLVNAKMDLIADDADPRKFFYVMRCFAPHERIFVLSHFAEYHLDDLKHFRAIASLIPQSDQIKARWLFLNKQLKQWLLVRGIGIEEEMHAFAQDVSRDCSIYIRKLSDDLESHQKCNAYFERYKDLYQRLKQIYTQERDAGNISDKDIADLVNVTRSQDENLVIGEFLSLHQISRVIKQALNTQPVLWSEAFSEFLKHIIKFLQNLTDSVEPDLFLTTPLSRRHTEQFSPALIDKLKEKSAQRCAPASEFWRTEEAVEKRVPVTAPDAQRFNH